MKINEVEQLVGVTKRNIRFYEKGGASPPGRTDNGYRDYGEADVEALRKIKLLRKLDVPLEEIRRMQQGTLTLTDGVRRHIIQLERAQDNPGHHALPLPGAGGVGRAIGQPGRGPLAGEDGADGGGRNAVYEHPKKRHCHPLRRDGGRRPGLRGPDGRPHRPDGLGPDGGAGGRPRPWG